MSEMNIGPDILGVVQSAFPLTGRPYAALGLKLGLSEAEVMKRIADLKAQGLVRLIGPVLDARKLGYQSTLVAMKVPQGNMAKAEKAIVSHPGISHGYLREHEYNVWVTLSARGHIEAELARLASDAGADLAFGLPVLRVFKLRAIFGNDGEAPETEGGQAPATAVELSDIDRKVINALPSDLALVPEPFQALAEQLKMTVDDLLAACQSLVERGVIRRFGAAVNHRKAGYSANAMACWAAANGKVDLAGEKLAALREVSHCYERQTNPLWRYNLFAMVHGRVEDDCHRIIGRISEETGLADSVTLFSTKEIKKVRIRYTV